MIFQVFVVFSLCYTGILSTEINIAGFFYAEDSEDELAFKFAVDRINHDFADEIKLTPIIEHVETFDSYNTSQRVCDLLHSGIGGILGPQSSEVSGIIESITNAKNIPYVKTFWDISSMPPGSAVNVFPDPSFLAKALVAVVEDMDWKSYAIIYENDHAMIRLHELMKSHKRSYTPEGHVPFTVWQLDPEGDNRPLFKELQKASETHVVLDCSTENIINILEQAKEVNMLSEYHSYILTSMDAHILDYGDLKQGATNITTLRLIDSQRHFVQAAVQDWVFNEQRRGRILRLTSETLKTEAALMYDAVYVYAQALRKAGSNIPVESLDCFKDGKWSYGENISTLIKETEIEGITGKIKFDKDNGKRNFFTIEITELTKNGFRKIGSWDPENKIRYTRSMSQMVRELSQSISNKTFIVTSRLGEPYLTLKDPNAKGNDRFEGYSMDLIDTIANDLKFKYEFYLVPDKNYGSFDKNAKQWNGLIRELRDRRADLAICDLTITYERRSAVDFTMPFMNLGISILFRKPKKQPPNWFSFLLPFSVDVWVCMATAYLGISILLYFLARISPEEWKNPHPCNPDPNELENTLAIYNAIWHNIGSLMQQGSDIAPQALSTRVAAGMWWFFVLIMISSYTANLAAFLTRDQMVDSIENVEDLASQTRIKYGVMINGSSYSFFRDSNVSLYQKMWNAMESRPSVFADTNEQGVERVLRSNNQDYAFLMESTSIEYQVEKHCELTQIGNQLDSKGYGIAMPFNSPYRIAISGSVLKLQQQGKLKELKTKWWRNKENKTCDKKKEKDAGKLDIPNVAGVFLVLIFGCAIGFITSILEFLWNVRKVAVQEKISPKEAFLLEFKFAIQCYGTTKPIRKYKSQSQIFKPEEIQQREVENEDEEQEEEEGGGFPFGYDETIDDVYLRMNGYKKSSRAQSYN